MCRFRILRLQELLGRSAEMVTRVVLEPSDQKTRRQRARISQTTIGRILGERHDIPGGVSDTSIGDYENGHKPLPFSLTPLDYENALEQALRERGVR